MGRSESEFCLELPSVSLSEVESKLEVACAEDISAGSGLLDLNESAWSATLAAALACSRNWFADEELGTSALSSEDSGAAIGGVVFLGGEIGGGSNPKSPASAPQSVWGRDAAGGVFFCTGGSGAGEGVFSAGCDDTSSSAFSSSGSAPSSDATEFQ